MTTPSSTTQADRLSEPFRPPAAVAGAPRRLHTELAFDVHDVIGEGDRVVARWSMRGIHGGESPASAGVKIEVDESASEYVDPDAEIGTVF